MTAFTKAHSRAASATGSMAREIAKRREKPYKTEKSLVKARKRKLDLHTSYAQAPPGYNFLPVGTPDLAERCKELSRQKGFPVNVVNAKPVSKYAHDPEKVSHHIHRIGYHFRGEVIDEACEELGYTIHRGQFIKEADLKKQHEESAMARILAQYNIDPSAVSTATQRESPQQVRAAIKELFPKIPEDDLEAIVKHAWEEGTQRVGTNTTLDLPRRVQLATIARIRHTYTDYDRLLRAFEWKDARAEVEPECLRKLIEWRGENDIEDDNELEEIVRETIVIDDDEAELGHASEADDEDSVTEVEPGDTSDTSIEVSHHVATDGDFGAESHDETTRNFFKRFQPRRRDFDQRNVIAKQKIDAARQRIRNHAPPAAQAMPPAPLALPVPSHDHVTRVDMQPDRRGQNHREVNINGEWYRLAPAQAQFSGSDIPPYMPVRQAGAYGQQYADRSVAASSSRNMPTSESGIGYALQDRPIASIESESGISQPRVGLGTRPVTPEDQRGIKRRRVESRADVQPAADIHRPVYPAETAAQYGRRSMYTSSAEVVDLTSPPRQSRQLVPAHAGNRSSTRTAEQSGYYAQSEHSTPGTTFPGRPPVQLASHAAVPEARSYDSQPVPYDPTQPMLQPPEQVRPARGHEVLDVSTPYEPRRIYLQSSLPSQTHGTPINSYYQAPSSRQSVSQPLYRPVEYQQQPQYARNTPFPVHGAPAPVQQAPVTTHHYAPIPAGAMVPASGSQYQAPGEHPRPRQLPADGAVAPTQYYYPR